MSIFLARRDEMQQGAKTNPSFLAVTTGASGFVSSRVINKPAGALQGHRVLVGIGEATGTGFGTPAIANSGTPSTAWTNHGSFTHANGLGKVTVFSKILSGSEPASWTVTGLNSSAVTTVITIAIQDGDGTIGTLVTNGNASGGAANITTAAVPTSSDGAVIVKFVNFEETAGGTSMTATWTTITERADLQSSGSGGGMTAATEDQATAGAGNTRLCAVTGTTPQLAHAGIAVY